MKRSYDVKPAFRASTFILALFLMILAPAANAITKHLSMIGENGQPLANTTITITFSDGTKEEEDTDDKGILMFDFKNSGVYTLTDPAGNVIKTISVAGSGMNTKVVVLSALGVAALLAVLAGGSDGDSNTTPETPVVPEVPDSGGSGGEEGSLAGIYDVDTSVLSNPGDHPVLLQRLVLQLQIIGTALTIIQLSSNPDFPSQMSGSIADDASFSASANGVYSGFPTLFQIAGTIVALQNLSFILSVGTDGGLPGGQAITYDGSGTKQ